MNEPITTPEQYLHNHWPVALILLGIWAWISLSMIATLWIRHRHTTLPRKLIWTVILLVPAVGWVLYLGIFHTPPPNKPGETCTGGNYSGGAGHL